jgi:hypothetical protein
MPQIVHIDLAKVDTVNQHAAAVRLVKPTSNFASELFPEPLRPIMPTFSPGLMTSETLLSEAYWLPG